jgi:hypothetical protein
MDSRSRIHTYIPLTLYPRRIFRAYQIFLKMPTLYHNYLAMSNTADVTGGKAIAISGRLRVITTYYR